MIVGIRTILENLDHDNAAALSGPPLKGGAHLP
jgi:hypothetical protein